MTTLSGPMLSPRSGGDPKQLVVMLHGYGSDGSDLIALGEHWQDLLPEALFVSPNGVEQSPRGLPGYHWFHLELDRPSSRAKGLPLVRPVVVDYLRSLWAETGVRPAQTLLVGFSQGAMTALHVGTSLEEQLMGIVAFSGAFVPPEGFADGSRARPPICLVHGTADALVDVSLTREAAQVLEIAGFEVSLHFSQGMGHGIDPEGLAFASAFIAGLRANR